ncbi:hypothetical protein UlMin_026224 [Ulmus minor]
MEFPEEIMVEILARLSVKTLGRFRCVSKSWLSMIRNPDFVRTHLRKLQSQAHLGLASSIILSRYGDSLLSIDPERDELQKAVVLDFPKGPYFPYYVKGTCDGLICLVMNDGCQGFLQLFNPTTREQRKLPIPSNFRSTREVFGIGFDSSSQGYKIVRVPSMYCKVKVPNFVPKVEVFSLKTNRWKKIPDRDLPPYFVEHIFQSTYANDGLYWLAEERESFRCLILRFDLATEKFTTVQLPNDEHNRNVSWIGSMKDSLCMLHTQRLSYVDIWATKDDKTWTKMITVSKSQATNPSIYSSRFTPLCFTKTGSLLLSVRGEGFVTYDPVEKSFKQLDIRGAEHYLQETIYIETLVSPYAGSENQKIPDPDEWLGDAANNRSIRQLILGLKRGLSCKSSRSKQP